METEAAYMYQKQADSVVLFALKIVNNYDQSYVTFLPFGSGT